MSDLRPKRVRVNKPVFKEAQGEPVRYYTEPTETPKSTLEDIESQRNPFASSDEYMERQFMPKMQKLINRGPTNVVYPKGSPEQLQYEQQVNEASSPEIKKARLLKSMMEDPDPNKAFQDAMDSGELTEDELFEVFEEARKKSQ